MGMWVIFWNDNARTFSDDYVRVAKVGSKKVPRNKSNILRLVEATEEEAKKLATEMNNKYLNHFRSFDSQKRK